jgi:succinoglycan biosynthesis protein ExoU
VCALQLMASAKDTAVLIAAYNAAQTLSRAVESALAQPETVEVCIVDDGSRDDTRAQAQAWAARDSRVTLLVQSNAGPGAARNSAIAATSAPWLAVLDADDYWLPGRLAGLFSHSANGDFICDALIRVPEHADVPAQAISQGPATPLSFEAFVLGNLGALRGPLDFGFLKPLMRRSFLDAHGLRYRQELRLGEDYEMYARALALGAQFMLAPPAGYVSVERAGSLSRDHGEEELRRLRDCDEELALIRPLRPADRRALTRHTASVDCRLQWVRLIRAVKTRDVSTALSTFRSPQVALYLMARLAEQAWLRSAGSIRSFLSMSRPTVRA